MRFDYLILLSCKLYLNASPVLMWFLGGDHEVRKACMGIGQQSRSKGELENKPQDHHIYITFLLLLLLPRALAKFFTFVLHGVVDLFHLA